MKTALIIVDPQMDFMPGGSLAVTDGDKIIPTINMMMENMKFDHIVVTGDLHPPDHEYFASEQEGKVPFDQMILNGVMDTLWPDHCVRNTEGSKFHPELEIPEGAHIFYKGRDKRYHPYSGFGNDDDYTGLNNFLLDMDVEEVYVVGLALDYCVKDTALDAKSYGFRTFVVEDGTKGIDPDNEKTFDILTDKEIVIIKADG